MSVLKFLEDKTYLPSWNPGADYFLFIFFLMTAGLFGSVGDFDLFLLITFLTVK